jgi:Tol biopolymer transport system component
MKPFLLVIFVMLIIASCTSVSGQNESSITHTATIQSSPSKPVLPTEALTRTPSQTPQLTKTLSSVPPTISLATLNAEATLEAFSTLCDEFETDSSRYAKLSPDGKWVSISCGYKRNQTLLVQNQEGIMWIFDFTDFIDPSLEGGMGSFTPLAWSLDNRFLYFTKVLGYSGGGNQCFPGHGVYGLYRLHLETGTLITLIPSDDRFPGDEIRFSPKNDYYAIDKDGIQITNLITGTVTKLDVSGVMEMSWSPDGNFLAFSVAKCGEDFVESSSVYVWDSSTKQTQVLFSSEEMLLIPRSWINNSLLGFEGEKWVDNDYLYTIFEYDIKSSTIIFSGTATPRP